MSTYNIVAASNEPTVVTEYTPEKNRNVEYQSEATLEKEFISRLCSQGYEYINVADEAALLSKRNRSGYSVRVQRKTCN